MSWTVLFSKEHTAIQILIILKSTIQRNTYNVYKLPYASFLRRCG